MLANCKYLDSTTEEVRAWLESHGDNPEPGVYYTISGCWDSWYQVKREWYLLRLNDYYPDLDEYISSYGVIDNVGQWKTHYTRLIADPVRKFCVVFNPFWKESEPREGGWRWHKWGPYLGDKNPQCEYLAHEPEIDMILCFQVYEVEG